MPCKADRNRTKSAQLQPVRCQNRMDCAEYKKKLSRWNVKRRNIIEDTLALLKGENVELYKKLLPILNDKPIEKPSKHAGGRDSDYFEITLSENDVQKIIDELFNLEACAVPTGTGIGFEEEAIQSREANRIARLVDEWNKLNTNT